MRKIILITGGQRSGKSAYAEQLARNLSPNPIYLATAHVWDDDFAQRICNHKARRGPQWTNIEEERNIANIDVQGRVVLLDCLTLWATNYLPAEGLPNTKDTAAQLCTQLTSFLSQDATYILVTNEVGLGGVSPNPLARRFADILGTLNQHAAAQADEAYILLSGLPLKLK